MRATRSLFLAEDGKTVVEEGDPKAFSLLVAKGGQISDADAEKYGVTFDEEKPKAQAEGHAKKDEDDPTETNTEAAKRLTEAVGKLEESKAPAVTKPARQDLPFQAPPKGDDKPEKPAERKAHK